MTKRTWFGGTGDWFDAADWTANGGPAGYPVMGDTLTVGTGTINLVGTEAQGDGTFNNVTVNLGSSGSSTATLALVGAIASEGFEIDGGGNMALVATGASAFAGSLNGTGSASTTTLSSQASQGQPGSLTILPSATFDLNGSLALGGTLDVEANIYAGKITNNAVVTLADAQLAGTITGSGSITLRLGAQLDGAISGQAITFADPNASLALAGASDAGDSIAGFTSGDTIQLDGTTGDTASYDAVAHTLTLSTAATGAVDAVLTNVTASQGQLVATTIGDNAVDITFANATSLTTYGIDAGARAVRADVANAMTVPGSSTKVDGTGVRIGIISDSFNNHGGANAAAAAGYLPQTGSGTSAVTVLADSAGSDEGQAMAELIHAIAPGAQLFFATAGSSQDDFAAAVTSLQQAGCAIITDDFSFPDTPLYQVAGPLDAAVSAAVAAGVDYFTAAGNYANTYEQGAFDFSGGQYNVFDNGYNILPVSFDNNETVQLEWNAPYYGTGGLGAPASPYTLYLVNSGGSIISQTSTDATVDGKSVAELDLSTSNPYDVAYLAIGTDETGTATQYTLRFENQSGAVIDDDSAGHGSGELTGQELIPGVNTVGAVPYESTPTFGGSAVFPEYFSDAGPGSIQFDSNGVPLATPENAGKVDFVAPDGITTTVFDPFYGTSAASPEAAAIAALVLQADPGLTTGQVTQVLEQSALPVNASAAEGGAGLLQADRAVALAEQAACYCLGTLILTERGETAVELLAIGDFVVTASGEHRPIRWIGRRSYAGRFLAANPGVQPIRFSIGSLGDGLPRRDLLVSPAHAMVLDGQLIPARCLVNGSTITQQRGLDRVDYVHVELDSHDVLLAEGVPSESFLDDDSRGMFHNAAEYAALYPASPMVGRFCAPRVDSGFELEAVRLRLSSVATQVAQAA